ncbi:unnamed protein product [Ectocarpus fasciculatus]
MGEPRLERRAGCKRARRTTTVSIAMRAVLVLLMGAPHIPTLDALKLSSISEERGHLGVGLLRAVEVVRGRYERAWTLVSAPEPTAEDLDTALELLQENAKQWESLEPAVKLWTERDDEEPPRRSSSSSSSSGSAATVKSSTHRSSTTAATDNNSSSGHSSSSSSREGERVRRAHRGPQTRRLAFTRRRLACWRTIVRCWGRR